METFRCPTCIGVLSDARTRRCTSCGQNMRRRRPRVLGEETRLGASHLPIDRWMLDRLHAHGGNGRRRSLPPVAWHGRFNTSPLAEPDFAATPSLIATPFAPSTILQETVATPAAAGFASDVIGVDEKITHTPPVVDALALDMYTHTPTIEPTIELSTVAPIAPVAPVLEPEPMPLPEPDLLAPPTPPEPPAPLAPRPRPQPQPEAQEELDPEVRALVDELYQQARAELSGDDAALFIPVSDEPDAVEPVVDDSPALHDAPLAAPPHSEPSSAGLQPPAEGTSAPPAAATRPSPSPEPPAAPQASSATTDERARGGWVPAFVASDRRQRQRGASE